jgi:glutamyl-tRNA synthetase
MPADLAPAFDLADVSHASPRFDARQMLALNARVLRGLDFAAVRDRLPDGATEPFWLAVRGNIELLTEARPWWQVVAGEVIPPPAEEPAYLRAALAALPPAPWDGGTWRAWREAVKAATGRKGKALFHPLRLALTGEESGPDLGALLPLIGPERAARRLALAGGA